MREPIAIAVEAARHLARRLAGGDGPRPWAPGVGETALDEPPARLAADPGPELAALARAVIEVVLGLEAGPGADPARLEARLQQAAGELLAGYPGLGPAVASRLASEIPRLVSLPRLAALAERGLGVPAPVAVEIDGDRALVGGRSENFARVLDDLERVAETDFAVLLEGETGTGKELLARRLHRLSPRREGPFVAVNCAALSPSLLESELFGHEKGAFTGADKARRGYVRDAQGGTLFLDEIGSTSVEFQLKLLRVLEEREVVPVGGSQARPVDFRLVCAAHRDLAREAEAGRFNAALLYRIRVVPLTLPPLRERPRDLAVLAEHLLAEACQQAGRRRRLAPEVLAAFQQYRWPGNVRELRGVIQRMVALSSEELIGPDMLPAEFRRGDAGALLERLGRMQGIPAQRAGDLAELLAGARGGELANRDLRERLGCSDSTAKALLKALSQAGLLQAVGERGGRKYRVNDLKEF